MTNTKSQAAKMKKQAAKVEKSVLKKVGNRFPVVGIGASAGGLEAFIALFSKIPANTGMAFVLVQHLDPTHPSLSVEIISRSTQMEIEEAKDGTSIKPNHIYVIPPNYNMGISDGILNLSRRHEEPRQNMAIDLFFQALAISEKRRTIGVVLSGTGTDGTMGLWAIKSEGGVTFAQDSKSAKYPGMPMNAVASGVVDLVLSPAEIARELVLMAQHPYLRSGSKESADILPEKNIAKVDAKIKLPEISDSSQVLHHIFNLLFNHTKVNFAGYKLTTIKRRIQRRMMVQKAKSLAAYAEYIEAHEEEVRALYNDILINVTYFFRDSESFRVLTEQVFPALLVGRSSDTPIRIWVPGCSTGEEVYSIAIALTEYLHDIGKRNTLQIFATDISELAIQKARLGVYSENVVRNVSEQRLKRFFDKIEGGYKIHKNIRDLCLFSKHDVTSDPPFAKLDFISCRNVMIYFSAVLQKRIIPIFHYALQAGGFLSLGSAENIGEFSRLFNLVEKTQKIYAKANVPTPVRFTFPTKSLRETLEVKRKSPISTELGVDFQRDTDKLILSRFTPPSVVVNSDLEILQFRGRTVPFLEPATGQPSLNLLKMARPELVAGLRATFLAVKKGNKSAVKQGLHFEADGKPISLDVEVLPTNPLLPFKDQIFLVLFKVNRELEDEIRDSGSKATKGNKKRAPDTRDRQIKELIKELSETREFQQSFIDQYEATQEELTSSNEELQSTNEEFQSTNEEIETAKEELQSTNEELVTVNDELQIRNCELTALTSDLNNLLASIEIPVLIVDADHRIRRFSANAKGPFNLTSSDIGRPISNFTSNFNLNLDALVLEVIETLSPKSIEVQDRSGSWSRIQIRPYRAEDSKVDGAIITLIDINLLKQSELREASVAETVPLPLAVVNGDFIIQSANLSFYKYFELTKKMVGQEIFKIFGPQRESIEKLRKAFFQTILENKQFTDLEIDCEVANLGPRKLILSGGKIDWIGTETAAALISFLDVTEQRNLVVEKEILLVAEKEARNQAEKANLAKDIFLATLSHELRTPLSPILTWAQLISQGKVDFEKAKVGAAVIEQSAKVQSQLIDDLLDISRIIAGKLTLKIRPVNFCQIVRTSIETVLAAAEKKKIQIDIDLGAESAMIFADPIRLQQIIWNLLTNAIKFSADNSIIKVEHKQVGEAARRFAQIKILDYGKGISPKFLPNIFNRFSQADGATTRKHGGLGLGLSIVRNLVELQNGTVTAENASVGQGAIFTVTFPMIAEQDTPVLLNEVHGEVNDAANKTDLFKNIKNEPPDPPVLNGLRILLVDDDANTRDAISIFLRSFGAEIMSVESAKAAFEAFPTFRPSVLVSDIAMPDEDGYSLIQRIRSLSPAQGGNTPALALTAYVAYKDVKFALDAGFQAHISKPIEANELGRAILKVSAIENIGRRLN